MPSPSTHLKSASIATAVRSYWSMKISMSAVCARGSVMQRNASQFKRAHEYWLYILSDSVTMVRKSMQRFGSPPSFHLNSSPASLSTGWRVCPPSASLRCTGLIPHKGLFETARGHSVRATEMRRTTTGMRRISKSTTCMVMWFMREIKAGRGTTRVLSKVWTTSGMNATTCK